MRAQVNEVIKEYMDFGGTKVAADFRKLINKLNDTMYHNRDDEEAYLKLAFIREKLLNGFEEVLRYEEVEVVVMCTMADLEEYYEKHKKKGKDEIGKIRSDHPKTKRKGELGKIVDEGEVPYPDRSDAYWQKEGRMKIIFQPYNKAIRSGAEVPKSYFFEDMSFLEMYYNLKAIEFGNWLSQQDRMNYVAGLGIALFDLHHVLAFTPHQVSFGGKLSVAFGARGRGASLAHFEPENFIINITRYSRPKKGSGTGNSSERVKLLVASGGVGSFAHEYGHALDYYAGKYIKPNRFGALSHGRSLRVEPNKSLLKEDNAQGYMERLLNKIIWKKPGKHSAYYLRLKKGRLTNYYFQRNELFARAFEVYIHYKMQKKKYRNIFLAETKYPSNTYLTPKEMGALEKDFDQLINAIKWKIKLRQ